MINRRIAITGLLLLLWAPLSAQQTQLPPPTAPVVPALPVQPLPIPPLLVKPMTGQPVLVQPLGDRAVPPTMVNIATAPTANQLATPVPVQPKLPPPLGSELRSKLKADEQHFNEKSASAKREFDLREAEEKKAFTETLVDKGFWERRKMTRAFRAKQAERAREFNDEQETKRRTYEWRYP